MQWRGSRTRPTTGRSRSRVAVVPALVATAHERITALQRSAGNRAVAKLLQRDFDQEAPLTGGGWAKKWRVKVKGTVTVTADGTDTKRPVAELMEFESGSGRDVKIAASVKATWDEWNKAWRWGDYGWRSGGFGDLPFEFKAYWKANVKGDAMDVAFVSITDAKLDVHGTVLYEAKPSAQGDTALLTITAYRGKTPLEVTARIKLKPPPKKPVPAPTWKERSLVVDGFPRDKATVSGENLQKVEDFWYSLSPETRTLVQNNQLLNGLKVRVTGHTSNTDKVRPNFDLGYARAVAIVDILRKLSGNAEGDNFAPMSKGEREIRTDDPTKEVEDPAQRKVVIELFERVGAVNPAP